MAIPYIVSSGTFNGGGGTSGSTFLTFSFTMTQQYEAFLPIQITCPNTTSISAGAEVVLYRSTYDNTNWETQGSAVAAFNKPTAAAQVQRRGFVIGPGRYLISVMVGGGTSSTWTAQLLTAEIVTAYA